MADHAPSTPVADPPAWCTDVLWRRFWVKVDTTAGPTGCWPWTGAYSKKSRQRPARPVFYVGAVWEGGRRTYQQLVPAARMALALTDGVPLWDRLGLEACHAPLVCDNPACVAPHHLRWGSPAENRGDRFRPGQGGWDFGREEVGE